MVGSVGRTAYTSLILTAFAYIFLKKKQAIKKFYVLTEMWIGDFPEHSLFELPNFETWPKETLRLPQQLMEYNSTFDNTVIDAIIE